MGNLGRTVFLGACGAALLVTLYLGSSVRDTSHARTYRRGPEAPAASGRDRASFSGSPTRSEAEPLRTGKRKRSDPATRARSLTDRKSAQAARAADRREQIRWEREMRRLERAAAHEQKKRERDERRVERKRRGRDKPAPLFEPPPLGPPVEGVEGFPKRDER